MRGNMIVFEDGAKIFADEWSEDKSYLNDGWSLYTEKIMNESLKMKKAGVVFLEGEETIEGQIEAREKALAFCEKDLKKGCSDVFPNILKAWVKNHKETLEVLRGLEQSS